MSRDPHTPADEARPGWAGEQDSPTLAQGAETGEALAGGVAHEFNNLLQIIQGAAVLLDVRAEDPAGVREIAAMILGAAERGAGITRRLLAVARTSSPAAEPMDGAASTSGPA